MKTMHTRRRRRLRRFGIGGAALLALIAAALLLWTDPVHLFGPSVKLTEETDRIVVETDGYAVAFRKDNGGIVSIRDLNTGAELSSGNRQGALWWAFADESDSWNAAQASEFTYTWSARKRELVFRYGGALQVETTVAFPQVGKLELRAKAVNGTGQTVESFRFPYELKVDAAGVKDGLLPMLPGAKLRGDFFRDNGSFEGQYPGVLFASYAALRTDGGAIAVYDRHGAVAETASIGFKNQVDDPGKTSLAHGYLVSLAPGAVWESPTVVLELGGDYPDSIAHYGEANGITDAKSLKEKLGDQLATYAALPFYKMDISALKDASWDVLGSGYVDKLPYPGVLHLVGFQPGGHDENYPDFLPADPKWGGVDAMQRFVRHAKEKGNKLVPYTNFSWWGVRSPTLAALPDGTRLEDVAARQESGLVLKEDYGPHSGYVMNPGHPFVRQRIAAEHAKLLEAAGFDGIFEDQWGIRNAPYLYNGVLPAGTTPSTAYFQGVRDYFASVKSPMYTEDGIDLLAGDSVGFMGTNYLWDLLEYRKSTAAYTDYYPMIGMLARDKVMLYQHDLAAETMTDDSAMLRWNAAMGCNLSADLYNGVPNPWVDVAGVFQRYVLAGYVDERISDYEQIAPNVTVTQFDSRTVTANWDTKTPYALDGDTALAPGGFDIQASDGTVRAGNYARYNGYDLDPGEHVLAEVRGEDEVRVYQPYGSDTTLRVKRGKGWKHAAAAAYEADGTKIADLRVTEDGNDALFDYVALIRDRRVAYVALTGADQPSQAAETFPKVKLLTNLALEGKARASSETADAFAAKQAVDGDPYTYWESVNKKFPQSLTVDLGQAADLGKLVLRLVPQEAWEKRDQVIEAAGSADGESFRTLREAQPYTFDPKAENRVEIPLEGGVADRIRYVRITVTGNTAWPAAQISEFEVYGK